MMAELTALKRRVAELEGEVAGEKVVTRHILEKLNRLTDLVIETNMKVDGLSGKVDRIASDVALTRAQLIALEPKIAGIVADALRDAWKAPVS